MRRIYDDTHLEEIGDFITNTIRTIPAETVSMYDYGTYRAQVHKVSETIQKSLDKKFSKGTVFFGKNRHAYGIGNNNSIEIIFDDGKEQQICGHLHLTNDMYGGCIACVTDIDDNSRDFAVRKIIGCNKSSDYDMKHKRFSGFEDKAGWIENYILREAKRNNFEFDSYVDGDDICDTDLIDILYDAVIEQNLDFKRDKDKIYHMLDEHLIGAKNCSFERD